MRIEVLNRPAEMSYSFSISDVFFWGKIEGIGQKKSDKIRKRGIQNQHTNIAGFMVYFIENKNANKNVTK